MVVKLVRRKFVIKKIKIGMINSPQGFNKAATFRSSTRPCFQKKNLPLGEEAQQLFRSKKFEMKIMQQKNLPVLYFDFYARM